MAGGILFIIGLWLLARPYMGIRHDGVLYSGQALYRLLPDIFSRDIFFAFGSQDDYSIYSRLIAYLLGWFDLGSLSMGLLLLALAGLLGAVFALFRQFVPPGQLWWGFVVLAAFPHLYGANQVFAFAEPFLTARVVAEPFALLALLAVWQGRLLLALAWAVLAMSLHPLVALPVFLVAWLFLVQADRRWCWALAGLPLLLLLAWAQVGPLGFLLQRFDAEWWAVVEVVNRNVFPGNWTLMDWSGVAFDVTLLAYASTCLEGKPRRLVRAVLGAGVLGVGAAILGADLARNVLLTGLQLWRSLWLAHLFALMLLPLVFVHCHQRDRTLRLVAWLLVCSVLTNAYPSALGALVLTGFLYYQHRRSGWQPSPGLARTLTVAIWLAILLATARSVRAMWLTPGDGDIAFNELDKADWLYLFSLPPLALALAWCYRSLDRRLALVLAGLLFVLGAWQWDHRSPLTRFIENPGMEAQELRRRIPDHAQIYWHTPKGIRLTWLVLQRPSYYSLTQAAGLLFKRDTALEMQRRTDLLIPFDTQEMLCGMVNQLNGRNDNCDPPPSLIKEVCDKSPALSYLVFEVDLGRWHPWSVQFPGADRPAYFYACDAIRQDDSITY